MPDRVFIASPARQNPARRERLWRWYAEALRRRADNRYDRHAVRVIEKAERRLGIDFASAA